MAGNGALTGPGSDVASSKRTGEDCLSSTSIPDCAICLQSCVHPVRLPCCHIFCFLCVKGASWQSKRCALCRQQIPEDFLERPVLLSPEELKAAAAGGGQRLAHTWYYEGRNGWWQYDERTCRELEEAFSQGKKSAKMLIAGFLYTADFENMVQYRTNEHGRRRKIKRDVVDIPKKGVAGLRLDPEPVPPPSLPAFTAPPRISSADGADTVIQSLVSLPSARPPMLLGRHLSASSSSPQVLEESFSQLSLSQTEDGDVDGDEDDSDTVVGLSSSVESEGEERQDWTSGAVRRTPRGAPPSSEPRSSSPDGQCAVTEV
ncbi:E3 ubiquitin-protein ligase rnf146-like [Synchiropus splendidus]|uniref:E3 ubiquitin-protein ligase rnf146-like n=1 Tax=Synchiropus splendidus TaxID=270530 RepID=UPI00237DF69C|nr:E3 ubiquitin-protein ligase rnf146-like [Synchiropus splendidus]